MQHSYKPLEHTRIPKDDEKYVAVDLKMGLHEYQILLYHLTLVYHLNMRCHC